MLTLAFVVLPFAPVLLLWSGSLPSLPARAAEAILPDGRRLPGELTQDREGRLHFLPAAKMATLPLEQLHQVRFAPAAGAASHASSAYRMTLRGGQWLTGELLGVDAKMLSWRTVWGARLTVPRDAVAAVTHTPGFATLFEEDFETDLKAWKVTGAPTLSRCWQVSGQRGLVLAAPGQEVTYTLAEALEAGRVQVSFLETGDQQGLGCLIRMEFQAAHGLRVVRVQPADGADAYTVDGVAGPGVHQFVGRSSGWHHLDVQFTPGWLILTLDNAILWHSRQQGPGGSLRSVRLASGAKPPTGKPSGKLAFDEFRLAQSVADLPFQKEDAGQDELWLLSGDQLLGSVRAADRRMLQLHSRFGERTFRWAEVRGLSLRRELAPARATQGEHVRVWFGGEGGGAPDELEGIVRLLEKTRLVIQHPMLGEVAIDRDRLRALRWLFRGHRIELESGFHHLGQNLVPTLENPRPDGLSLRRVFHLEALPKQAYVTVDVTELKGGGDGLGPALARGDGATQLLVNDQPVDYLNRHVERASRTPQRLRLTVPSRMLRIGENVVVLRQIQNRDTESYEDCGLSRLAVELPR